MEDLPSSPIWFAGAARGATGIRSPSAWSGWRSRTTSSSSASLYPNVDFYGGILSGRLVREEETEQVGVG